MKSDWRNTLTRCAVLACVTWLLAGCARELVLPADRLAAGTWGGNDAGVIVGDSAAHVHVGCTLGDFPMPVTLDAGGHFTAQGSYLLRAYPVAVGPRLPAQFSGTVRRGQLTLTVLVNDTVEKQLVTKGPVTVTFGREPEMGPCPICRKPRT